MTKKDTSKKNIEELEVQLRAEDLIKEINSYKNTRKMVSVFNKIEKDRLLGSQMLGCAFMILATGITIALIIWVL